MEIKINAKYKNGVLIPKIPLNLEENTEIEVILIDDIYKSFSVAGQDDNVEKYLFSQKEVIEDE